MSFSQVSKLGSPCTIHLKLRKVHHHHDGDTYFSMRQRQPGCLYKPCLRDPERSLLESRQRTLLPRAFVLFLRGPPSPVQDGRRDGWDRRDKSPDDRRLVFDVILTCWLTVSALWDYCLCQFGQQSLHIRLPFLQFRLLSLHTDCLCNLGRLSPPFWNVILADSHSLY
jgi:hypothetical protein